MSLTERPPTATEAALDMLNQLRAERAARGDTLASQETILMETQVLATLAIVEALAGLREAVVMQQSALARIADSLATKPPW